MYKTLNVMWKWCHSLGSGNSIRYPLIWLDSVVNSGNEDNHAKQWPLTVVNALKQNEHMPLPSSFLLFASSSFFSLAFSASSAFAETKIIKFLHLFCVYIKSENIGGREKKFLTYFL